MLLAAWAVAPPVLLEVALPALAVPPVPVPAAEAVLLVAPPVPPPSRTGGRSPSTSSQLTTARPSAARAAGISTASPRLSPARAGGAALYRQVERARRDAT